METNGGFPEHIEEGKDFTFLNHMIAAAVGVLIGMIIFIYA